MKVKRTERGWVGHFCDADRCQFRRNTLLEYGDIGVVVSTVVRYFSPIEDKYIRLGVNRYFETMVFYADDSEYRDSDVRKEINVDSQWRIDDPDDELGANAMHEKIVREIEKKLENGSLIIGESQEILMDSKLMIADRLRKARLMAGLTQKSLSDATLIPLSLIRKFERDQVTPSSRQLLTIARMCGLGTEYFFRRDTVTLIDTRWFTPRECE